jgi:hypothetical protein
MRVRRPEGHVTDRGNTRVEETRRQRRREASSEEGHGPKRLHCHEVEWNGEILRNELTLQFQTFRYQQNDQTEEDETNSICAIHWR